MFVGSVFVLYYGLQMLPIPTHRTRAGTAALVTYAIVLVALVATARDVWTPPAQGVVKIGVIVPTEGPYAMLGNSFVKAVEMARDDVKDTTYRCELVIRDSGPDPQTAVDVIRRVVRVDKVDAIVVGVSLIGQVTKRLLCRRTAARPRSARTAVVRRGHSQHLCRGSSIAQQQA
jgi:Periplasmic binding protein